MTESTLSNKYSDLRIAIGRFLGLDLAPGEWTADEIAIVAMILKKGLQQFYFPPRIDNDPPHEWSFLKPTTYMATIASYSTGTIAVEEDGTTVTLTDGVWPTWTATNGTLVVDSVEYEINARTDNLHIELTSAWTEDTETEAEYTLWHDGNYDMPDDFGGIEGPLTYEPSEHKPDIRIAGEGTIRNQRGGTSTRSYPYYAAVRPKIMESADDGQRFEIMFFPVPDDVYTLSYQFRVLADTLASDEYPYGGAAHAATIEASCLAAAELQEDDKKGPRYEDFMRLLTASIQIDKTSNRQEYFGYNSDNSDGTVDSLRRRQQSRATYNGEI